MTAARDKLNGSNELNELNDGLKEIFLNPGDFHFCGGGARTRISTLLGSCISITLWHPRRRIGGMCHYMLTERRRPANALLDGRFADEAFELFLRQVDAAGTHPREYRAKMFGGSNMLAGTNAGMPDIGSRNIEYGRRLLAARNMVPMSEHVGGSGRRKLHFDVWSGEVWLAFPQGSGAHIRNAKG